MFSPDCSPKSCIASRSATPRNSINAIRFNASGGSWYSRRAGAGDGGSGWSDVLAMGGSPRGLRFCSLPGSGSGGTALGVGTSISNCTGRTLVGFEPDFSRMTGNTLVTVRDGFVTAVFGGSSARSVNIIGSKTDPEASQSPLPTAAATANLRPNIETPALSKADPTNRYNRQSLTVFCNKIAKL